MCLAENFIQLLAVTFGTSHGSQVIVSSHCLNVVLAVVVVFIVYCTTELSLIGDRKGIQSIEMYAKASVFVVMAKLDYDKSDKLSLTEQSINRKKRKHSDLVCSVSEMGSFITVITMLMWWCKWWLFTAEWLCIQVTFGAMFTEVFFDRYLVQREHAWHDRQICREVWVSFLFSPNHFIDKL